MADTNFLLEDDFRLEATRSRFSNVLKKHAELSERLSRDSDKSVFERLQKEFDTARASQSQEIHLDGEEWNDGLLATIRERTGRLWQGTQLSIQALIQEKITYKVGNKFLDALVCGFLQSTQQNHILKYLTENIDTHAVICCLEGARIGIQYETFFAGEPCELYHIVLESKSFLEKMTVLEHTIPFFIPVRDAENDLLSSNAMKFIDRVGELLQAYVDRREQVRLIKELYGNQIGELYHSLPFNMVEFVLDDFECKVTVTLRYEDLICVLPTRVRVLAWPRKTCTSPVSMNRRGNGVSGSHPIPARLSYAEEALRSMSLPEAFAEIVLNLPQALQQLYQQRCTS